MRRERSRTIKDGGNIGGEVVQPGEEFSLDHFALGKVCSNSSANLAIVPAISVEDVVQALIQSDYGAVGHSLVSVVDDLFVRNLPLRLKIPQADMLAYDIGNLVEFALKADFPAHLGMIAALFQTNGLADVMEKGAGDDLVEREVHSGLYQTRGNEFGNPGNDDAMLADVIQHPIFSHERVAFLNAGDHR
jgi:hypothetical protein